MELDGRQVSVVGLGASGRAAAELCLDRGATVRAYDEMLAPGRLGDAVVALEGRGLEVVVGPLPATLPGDLVVVSPGVPHRPAFDAAEAAGVEVIGELELASRFLTRPIALVGGTNGKSTVTALLGAMMRVAEPTTFVGGNLGEPLARAVGHDHPLHVVEISSFQAERVPTLHAHAAALLNVSEDHLDRYPSFESYAQAKGNPFEHQGPEDVAVVPAGDSVCARQAARGRGRRLTFGLGTGDVRFEGDAIVDTLHGERYPRTEIRLRGRHNLLNVCAAVAMARALGASHEAVATTLSTFTGLPHRNVLVAEADGVRFYDDSKATNVGAAVAALEGLEEARAVLIAGGRDKHGSYAPLVHALDRRGRALVVIGEAAERIAAAAEGTLPVHRVATMREAVARAASEARRGDAVLLSPACSSFDQYENYGARGDDFVASVETLLSGRPSDPGAKA